METRAEPSAAARYILALAADPNWPTEQLVPCANAVAREVGADLGVAMALAAQQRPYNPSASGARFYDLEISTSVTPVGIKNALVDVLERQKDRAFRGVPVHVRLYTATGALASHGTAHLAPR